MLASITEGPWSRLDVDFLERTVRALMAIGGAQLRGLGHILVAGSPFHLHPLVTLLRGVAEAMGWVWWLSAPILPDPAEGVDISAPEWLTRAKRVVDRSQLHHLEELALRRARREASKGKGSEEYQQVDRQIGALKEHFSRLHGHDASLSGKRRTWRIGQETIPKKTDLVIAVTEYAHGERYRGSGLNPYRLYSGYAHASVEIVFAHQTGTTTAPLSALIVGDEDEVKSVVGAALRTFAVGHELALHMFGMEMAPLREWEGRVDSLILERPESDH
ncbi:MAG: hypothetical protein M3277_06715 [Actinomycetota bacterium]|nr:hypothetical protein [Actinomycetota bacterium]